MSLPQSLGGDEIVLGTQGQDVRLQLRLGVLERLHVLEFRLFALPHPSGSRLITLPGLGFKQDQITEFGQIAEELLQSAISVIQMNPHADRETEDDVEFGAALVGEVVAEFDLGVRIHDVQSLEGDVRCLFVIVVLGRSLNEKFVHIYAVYLELGRCQGGLKMPPEASGQILEEEHQSCQKLVFLGSRNIRTF